MYFRPTLLLAFSLLFVALFAPQASASASEPSLIRGTGWTGYFRYSQGIVIPFTARPEIKPNQLYQASQAESVVRAVMFWMDGCPHCEEVIDHVLPPLYEKYGDQFELFMIEVVTTQDIEILYQVAGSYSIPKEQTGVPFVVIGENVLVGSDQVRDQLPALIDEYIAQGGVDWSSNPVLKGLLPTVTETPHPADAPANVKSTVRDNGFTLAIVIMIGMAITLLYSIVAFAIGKFLPLPRWTDWLIPVLLVVGFGVAGYLSYVETQAVEAVCGPIGDCNTVQQSRYARLFDILPVGVLGLMGYVALLTAWLARRSIPQLEKTASIGFFGMTFFAVLFSLYLTYLEAFIIRAVCIWCLTSAVIVTILLFLGTGPAVQPFVFSEEDE